MIKFIFASSAVPKIHLQYSLGKAPQLCSPCSQQASDSPVDTYHVHDFSSLNSERLSVQGAVLSSLVENEKNLHSYFNDKRTKVTRIFHVSFLYL